MTSSIADSTTIRSATGSDAVAPELAALNADPVTLQQLNFHRILHRLADHLVTPYGRAKLAELRFSRDPEWVARQLGECEEMVALMDGGYPLPLSGFPDLRDALERCRPEESFLEAEELLAVKTHLDQLGEVQRHLQEHREDAPSLTVYGERLHRHRQIAEEIDATIDRTGEIYDNASPELRQIRIRIRSLEADQKKVFQRVQKAYSEYSQDDIVTLRDGRVVLGIQPQFINKVNGILHGTSGSGATVFIEPMETLSISNEIQNLRVRERTEIIKILRFLTGLVRQVRDDLYFGIENLAILDLIHARGRLARELDATVPTVTGGGPLRIHEGRHPLLILKAGRDKVVPLSVELGDGVQTLVITGPNAGGKTVAMKTVGLLVLMTQMGLMIPAREDSVIPLIPRVLADIGDRQSLDQDLSTFSAHIVRLREILEQAVAGSLVLMDEVGTGTDPREGAALAIAILDELTGRGALTIATTHHGEIKAYAHDTDSVGNGSMEFDLDTLEPTYRLRTGIPGSSYAFEIARRYGLPETLLGEAQRFVGEEKDRLEDLILDLERRLLDQEQLSERLQGQLAEAEATRKRYEDQMARIKARKAELRDEAAREARRILAGANAVIERAVREIREEKASRGSIKKGREAVQAERKQLDAIIEKPAPRPTRDLRSLKVGDRVLVTSLDEAGELLEDVGDKSKVRVQVGHIKMTVDAASLQSTRREPAQPAKVARQTGERQEVLRKGIGPELDLRGLDSQQAIEETNLYLHDAMDSDWDEVRIVHGKGTGTLRKVINEFLARDERVLRKRLGKWGEGDTGVTVVTLRKPGRAPAPEST